MIQPRKAKPVKTYNQMLTAYQDSCLTITKNYCHDMDKFTESSIRALCSLFQSYLHQRKNVQDGCQSIFGKSTVDDSQNSGVDNSQSIPFGTYVAPQIVIKKVQMANIQGKDVIVCDPVHQIKDKKEFLLMEDEDSEEDSATKRISPPKDFKNKDIAEIILQSQRKAEQKFQNQKNNGKIEFLEDQESEYGLSDFSNDDGNDSFDEEPYFVEEEVMNKPLFGGLFSKTQSSESNSSCSTNLLNFNFTSKQLLKSPKKAPKHKRTYIGNKKIPQWAQDIQIVNSMAAKQDKNAFASIFGKCVVQHLDTNVIFKREKQNIHRTSSAKWNHMFLT